MRQRCASASLARVVRCLHLVPAHMPQTLAPDSSRSFAAAPRVASSDEEGSRVRQLRSLVALFGLYASVLVFVLLFVEDGGDIGSVLAGIAGHAVYASYKAAVAWREASWLDAVRGRMLRARHAR